MKRLLLTLLLVTWASSAYAQFPPIVISGNGTPGTAGPGVVTTQGVSGGFPMPVDTEMPAALSLTTAVATPTAPPVGAFLMCKNGSTWDPCLLGDGGFGAVTASTMRVTLGGDPCSGAKTFVPISQVTGTQLFSGTASNRTYVCVFMVTQPAASTQTFALVSGTGTVCATSTGAMIGGTSAANGMQLPFSLGSGLGSVAKSDTDAENVCLLQSTTDRISGVIGYVVAPN